MKKKNLHFTFGWNDLYKFISVLCCLFDKYFREYTEKVKTDAFYNKWYEEMFRKKSQGLGDFILLSKFALTEEPGAAITILVLDFIVLLCKKRIKIILPTS